MKGYRIRRVKDNLYSVGGSRPKFDAVGCVWLTANQLRSHLYRATYKDDILVVEVRIAELNTKPSSYYLPDALEPLVHFCVWGKSKEALCGLSKPEALSRKVPDITCGNCKKTKLFQRKSAED